MSANPRGKPGQSPIATDIASLMARVEALEAQVSDLPVRVAAPSGPILEAGFGIVSQWEKNEVSVRPMPFGDPTEWKTATYSDESEIVNCANLFQLFVKGVTPVFWYRMANMSKPVVVPLHPDVDAWPPSMNWTEPADADLEASADLPIADAPDGGWDDISELEGL